MESQEEYGQLQQDEVIYYQLPSYTQDRAGSWEGSQELSSGNKQSLLPRPQKVTRHDLVSVATSAKSHMPLVYAMRRWRKVSAPGPDSPSRHDTACKCSHPCTFLGPCMMLMQMQVPQAIGTATSLERFGHALPCWICVCYTHEEAVLDSMGGEDVALIGGTLQVKQGAQGVIAFAIRQEEQW